MTVARIDAQTLRARLEEGALLGLVDVREERFYGEGHILPAVHAGLGRLETDLPRLVPALGVPLVLCDGGERTAERAAAVAERIGYRDIAVLDGGTAAWSAAGHRLFTGTHVTGAALAETIAARCPPPMITADELVAMRRDGPAPVVLDSRPWPDYLRKHIPGGISCPGGELVYRLGDLAPDPATPVVVNCAGRTRALLGAKALIDAEVPNPVYALDQGTLGFWRVGLEVAVGDGPRAGPVSEAARLAATDASRRLAERCAVAEIDAATLASWRREAERHPLYLLDVREPEEYAAGHVAGARHAPGGQLVECPEDWIGVRGGRILLLDDDGVRARLAAAWLRQLRYPVVAVLSSEVALPRESTAAPADLVPVPDAPRIAASAVPDDAMMLDLGASRDFIAGHPAGAVWGLRTRLGPLIDRLPAGDPLVILDRDGRVAPFAVADLAAAGRKAFVLESGLDGWRAAGRPVATGREGMLEPPDDAYHPIAVTLEEQMAMGAAYLDWQHGLDRRLPEDGLIVPMPLGPR